MKRWNDPCILLVFINLLISKLPFLILWKTYINILKLHWYSATNLLKNKQVWKLKTNLQDEDVTRVRVEKDNLRQAVAVVWLGPWGERTVKSAQASRSSVFTPLGSDTADQLIWAILRSVILTNKHQTGKFGCELILLSFDWIYLSVSLCL